MTVRDELRLLWEAVSTPVPPVAVDGIENKPYILGTSEGYEISFLDKECTYGESCINESQGNETGGRQSSSGPTVEQRESSQIDDGRMAVGYLARNDHDDGGLHIGEKTAEKPMSVKAHRVVRTQRGWYAGKRTMTRPASRVQGRAIQNTMATQDEPVRQGVIEDTMATPNRPTSHARVAVEDTTTMGLSGHPDQRDDGLTRHERLLRSPVVDERDSFRQDDTDERHAKQPSLLEKSRETWDQTDDKLDWRKLMQENDIIDLRVRRDVSTGGNDLYDTTKPRRWAELIRDKPVPVENIRDVNDNNIREASLPTEKSTESEKKPGTIGSTPIRNTRDVPVAHEEPSHHAKTQFKHRFIPDRNRSRSTWASRDKSSSTRHVSKEAFRRLNVETEPVQEDDARETNSDTDGRNTFDEDEKYSYRIVGYWEPRDDRPVQSTHRDVLCAGSSPVLQPRFLASTEMGTEKTIDSPTRESIELQKEQTSKQTTPTKFQLLRIFKRKSNTHSSEREEGRLSHHPSVSAAGGDDEYILEYEKNVNIQQNQVDDKQRQEPQQLPTEATIKNEAVPSLTSPDVDKVGAQTVDTEEKESDGYSTSAAELASNAKIRFMAYALMCTQQRKTENDSGDISTISNNNNNNNNNIGLTPESAFLGVNRRRCTAEERMIEGKETINSNSPNDGSLPGVSCLGSSSIDLFPTMTSAGIAQYGGGDSSGGTILPSSTTREHVVQNQEESDNVVGKRLDIQRFLGFGNGCASTSTSTTLSHPLCNVPNDTTLLYPPPMCNNNNNDNNSASEDDGPCNLNLESLRIQKIWKPKDEYDDKEEFQRWKDLVDDIEYDWNRNAISMVYDEM